MEREKRSSLVAAGNTYNPCLLVLREKGYDLWAEEGLQSMIWSAAKDGHEFAAYSPPELLGIVVLWEHLGADWNRKGSDVLGELCENQGDRPQTSGGPDPGGHHAAASHPDEHPLSRFPDRPGDSPLDSVENLP
ncbi:MAG TPA: hypothetical protein VGH33_13930 [Isosphaeraceae bacterium]|jgi:hypothetical protein